MFDMAVATSLIFAIVALIHAAQCLITKRRPAWLTWIIWGLGLVSFALVFLIDEGLIPNLASVIFHLFALPWFATQLLLQGHLHADKD